MAKILETTDEQMLLDVKKIQDKAGNALDKDGNPRIGCKKVDGKLVPLNQITPAQWVKLGKSPGYSPPWAGTTETFAVETDEVDPSIKRLELTDDIVEKIEKAKLKDDADCDPDELKLKSANVVKDKPPKE